MDANFLKNYFFEHFLSLKQPEFPTKIDKSDKKLIRRGIIAESQAAAEICPKFEIFYEKHIMQRKLGFLNAC